MRSFHQELTEDQYSRELEITFPDCGPDRTAKLSTLLGYAVAIGGADYDARGLTYERLAELGQVFLLSRIALRVHRIPALREVLNVETWEEGIRGVHVQRSCVMVDEAGEAVVSARSQWIVVDPATHKLLRPGSFTARTIPERGVELDCPPCGKVLLPAQGSEALGSRRVVWSDLDGNGHIYSGNYGGIFWDYLPADLQRRRFRDFSINYHKEAVLGETLTLSGCREENGYVIAGTGGSGLCFTARCVFDAERRRV